MSSVQHEGPGSNLNSCSYLMGLNSSQVQFHDLSPRVTQTMGLCVSGPCTGTAAGSETEKQKLTSAFVLKRGAVGPRGPPGPPGIAGVPGVDGIDVSLKFSLSVEIKVVFLGHHSDHQTAAVWVGRLCLNDITASIFTHSHEFKHNDCFHFTRKQVHRTNTLN